MIHSIYNVYQDQDARQRDALYTYVNVCCSGGQTTQQRAPLQQSKAKRARTPAANPAGFARTRIFVPRSVGLRVVLTLESAVASSGRGPAQWTRRRRRIRVRRRCRLSGRAYPPAPSPARGIIYAYSRTVIECCQGDRWKGEEESSHLTIVLSG